MANARKIKIADLPTTTPNKVLEVEVYHSAGGPNYFHGGVEPAAFWLSVTPCEIEPEPAGSIFGPVRKYGLGKGIKIMLEHAKRFNAKTLAKWAVDGIKRPEYKDVLAKVAASENLTLLENADAKS